jgi:hypothetical protein
MIIYFVVQKLFSFMQSQSILLVAEPFEFYLESYCLCPLVTVHSLHFFCANFKVSCLMLWSLIHFELILHRVKNMHFISAFYMQIQFPQKHLLKRLSFLHSTFLVPLSKSGQCIHMDLYLGLLFCSSDLHVCFLCWYHSFFFFFFFTFMALW